MEKVCLTSVDDFMQKVGEPLGTSDWLLIDQEMINRFAAATKDHQWIHVDTARAEQESPLHATIAHGYLTLSLIIHLLESAFDTKNVSQIVNFGIDKFSFQAPVPVNSRVRIHATLKSALDLGVACKAKIQCQMEIENQEKNAFEGLITLVYYFEK